MGVYILVKCLSCLRLAHIRGNRHKKKVASLRKQAERLAAAAETDRTSLLTDRHTDALTEAYVDDNIDDVLSD